MAEPAGIKDVLKRRAAPQHPSMITIQRLIHSPFVAVCRCTCLLVMICPDLLPLTRPPPTLLHKSWVEFPGAGTGLHQKQQVGSG